MTASTSLPQYDVIIIGGSYAGLSAAMQLARARRRILIIDAGVRRNRFASASHGFLGQDGVPPGQIADTARAQVLAYPTATWLQDTVSNATRTGNHFTVVTDGKQTVTAKRLILATGVVDELPAIPGLSERWGKHVFHCPYCHGYELNEGRIGVLGISALSIHHAVMLPDWGQVTFFLNGAFTPDAAQLAWLAERNVTIETARIKAITDTATVVLDNGATHVMDGLFSVTHTRIATPLVQQLGCELETGPTGQYIRINDMKETTVPGVFACGDVARAAGNVAISVGEGAMAGASAHRSIMFEGHL
jgi:thioredoxin reductase